MPSNRFATQHSQQSIGRRKYLALGASATAALVAGCSAAVDFLAGMVLDDVNVVNGTDRAITGSIDVTDPDGDVVLDTSFDLAPEAGDDDAEPDEDSQAVHGDVLTGAGEYAVSIELDDIDDFDAENPIKDTVEVSEPADEHLMVFLGAAEIDDLVAIVVIEELSDLEEFEDNA